MRRTRVKICGVRSVEIATAAADAGADAVGLVFAKDSPRCIDSLELARKICHALPPWVAAVGVFDSLPGTVEWLDRAPLQWAQIHGHVTAHEIAAIAERAAVIRATAFDSIQMWDRCSQVRGILVDAPIPGSGKSIDHAALADVMPSVHRPVILAGGLTAQNVYAAISTVRPYAVDVSSGVESSPGVKDAGLIRAFCEAVKNGERANL